MRQDAARNRRAILLATEELLSRHRPDEVTIEQVAAAAGVGKGTVFHRFGSRMGLMLALMKERATELGEAVQSSDPPLGPGAPPRERLLAFLSAVVEWWAATSPTAGWNGCRRRTWRAAEPVTTCMSAGSSAFERFRTRVEAALRDFQHSYLDDIANPPEHTGGSSERPA